jgi:DUF309 family protein family protein
VGPLPLPVRNRLAELILGAFEPGEARATVLALASASAGSAVSDADADRLLALGWFEPAGPGEVRLLGAHRDHGPSLAARSARAATMLRDWRDPDRDDMTRLLDRAAALANHGLFFEVHELLEPVWFRATEPARTALQGLIQIAVGFHHLENGNREGARSLLVLGVAKTAEAGAILPLDLPPWLRELRAVLAGLTAGESPARVPRWPRPVTMA